MRTLVHLSDLHFGTVDSAIVAPLLEFIRATKPDFVVISGDLTQRARTAQFIEARRFIDAIPFPYMVIPGNHDVPLHNVFARLFRMLDKFRRYICEDLEPFYVDDEIAIAGVNTTRALTGKNGRINQGQLEKLRTRFATVPATHVKIVVTHHPFDLPPGIVGDRVVLRAKQAMHVLAQIPVDMLLAGHFHVGGTTRTTTRYKIDNFAALIVAAGTSTSTRGRGQPNSLNVIRIDKCQSGSDPAITIAQHQWHPDRATFELSRSEKFTRTATGWTPRQ